MSEFVPTALCRKCDMMFTFNGYPGCVAESINDSERYIMQCYHGTEGYFSKDPKDDGKFIQEELQIGPAESKEEMKACPFCGKEDGLEIVWDEWVWVPVLMDQKIQGYREVEKGHGDNVTIRCNCGETLTRCKDGLVCDIEDRIGMDEEITDDMIEEELIRIWNLPRR